MTRMDRVYMWIAWHLPRGLVYWTAMRLIAHATQGPWAETEAPSLGAMDALARWEAE